ncbi:abscisic acid ABA receptor [Colletotrichum orchidophilum]|uniref:Abscisic acid ABA receptor n=1 Tax=Colletotrichum orchidophilum TaxID=1209926 RepID=A0A1G4BHZ9_9PEZI|nr:abscisic acid ABA receptor [Colletotrichum orchidophilum]OHF00938.1 abscisic acid ABA receptor [Colletotrichum orchidophilum]
MSLDKPRYIPTPTSLQEYASFIHPGHPEVRVQQALTHIISANPPLGVYTQDQCRGFFRGPTSLAYLLLRIHATYPEIKIQGQSLRQWATSYAAVEREGGDSAPCGLACESAAFWAVATILDATKAPKFREVLERLADEDDHPYELLFGYAGILYMIRAVEFSVRVDVPFLQARNGIDNQVYQRPETASQFAIVKSRIVEKTLGAGPLWTWRGKRYIGAVHGDIGILTQLLLTDPKLAENPMIRRSIERQLEIQRENGNWETKDDPGNTIYEGLTQFCHGAPGFILSLVHIERFFPDLKEKIGKALKSGREFIWKEGLLRKEPCLCHGTLGNSLAFPPGQRRDHFLAWSLPSKVAEEHKRDETLFPPEDGARLATFFDYWPSAAWTWMVCGEEVPGFILYTDV